MAVLSYHRFCRYLLSCFACGFADVCIFLIAFLVMFCCSSTMILRAVLGHIPGSLVSALISILVMIVSSSDSGIEQI